MSYKSIVLVFLTAFALNADTQPLDTAKPRIRVCASLPLVQIAGQTVGLEARQQLGKQFSGLLGSPLNPVQMIMLQSILEAEVPLESAQQGCPHLWRLSIVRAGGKGMSGLGNLGVTLQTATHEATAIGSTVAGGKGAKGGSAIEMATRAAGVLVSRKPKPKPYEIYVTYELIRLADGTSMLNERANATGQAADESI